MHNDRHRRLWPLDSVIAASSRASFPAEDSAMGTAHAQPVFTTATSCHKVTVDNPMRSAAKKLSELNL